MLIASPVPDIPEILGIRKERLDRAKDLLGTEPDIVLPYDPFVAFRETINPTQIGEYLNKAYDQVADHIVSKNRSDLTTMLNEVHRVRDSGDIEGVEPLYKQVLETHRNNYVVWLEYGSYLRALGRLEEALNAYTRAEQLGGSTRAWRELCVTNLYLRRFDDAQRIFRNHLVSALPPGALFEIARLFAARDQVDVSFESYDRIQRSPELSPDLEATVLHDLGSLYLRIGRPEVASEYFEKGLRQEPSAIAVNYNLAVALTRSDRAEEAKKYFEKAVAIFEQQPILKGLPRDHANRLQAMSQAYGSIGRLDKAVSLMQQAIAIARTVHSTIFSSFKYKEVPADAFVLESLAFVQQIESVTGTRES